MFPPPLPSPSLEKIEEKKNVLINFSALGIPVSNYTYDDCKLMNRAKQMKLPYAGKLVEVQRLRQALGLTESNMEEKIIRSSNYKSIIKSPMMSYYQFTEALKLSPNNSLASQLFKLCDKVCY